DLQSWLKSDRQGPCAHLAPDIHIRIQNFRYLGRPILGSSRFWDSAVRSPIGFHRPNGILCAWGEKIRAGVQLGNPQMIHVAPTVFQLLGLPIPAHFTGQVLLEMLKSPLPEQRVEVHTAREQIAIPFSDETEAQILSGLRQQGYFQ
ncbi:MAG: hypothetical protein ABH878_04470, partial [bacterium]